MVKAFNWDIRDEISEVKKAINKESDNEATVVELQVLLDKLEDSIIKN